MSITVNFYSFAKKINSTARPGTSDKTYPCRLKESCGIFNPVIALDMGLSDSPREYNYANIPNFDRYYFVKEWTFEQGLWYATLEEDTLASWKISIGNSTCYILRSSEEYDSDIIDTTYPATSKTTTYMEVYDSPWDVGSLNSGSFVVGIAGDVTTYYIFTQTNLKTFFDWIYSDSYAEALVGDWLSIFPQLKANANPIQYITSVMWFPFIASGTDITSIRVGWVNVPATAKMISGTGIIVDSKTFNKLEHPQNNRGRYVKNAPYSTYSLFFPPWGRISLDAELLANYDIFYAVWYVDLRTGHATLNILVDEHTQMITSWIHSQVGISFQISQIVNQGYGLGNIIQPVISTGTSLLKGQVTNATIGAISEGAGAIGDSAKSKIPSATTIGSSGGFDSLLGNIQVQYEFKELVDEDIDHRGRPLCKNKQINTLSGFILVADADIKIPCTRQEQEAIRTYLEGGFFYE